MFSMYQENCQESWWINLLYISNYVPYSTCLPWTWYVSADFQLHVLSPLLLLLIYKDRTRGFLLAAFIILVSIAGALAFYFWYEIPAGGIAQRDQSHQKITLVQHVQTQFRLALFIVGLCLGNLLFRIKQNQLKIKLSKPQLLVGWTVAVLLILSTVLSTSIFDDPQYVHIPWLDSVYHVWSRQAVGLGVTWVILVCTIGSGGIIDKILSWKALIPLSRLTYCVYLLHFFVQQLQIYRTRTSVTVDTFDIWYLFFSDVFISYILATFLYLGVEAPVSNIFNNLFKDSQTSTEKSQNVVMSAITNP
ncbi:nose resistant to fluoxetine protein 6-like [Homalodisca vitripennis]|uniref:nose resistant to fluoxetine protein 6-like n=1 Tax=Homalodisca vitripennis TaxID=197043 RepID=UPI001EECA68A|nr:nose resistant to fluoxetine protein 6-like [Homalodisca vitripennis]